MRRPTAGETGLLVRWQAAFDDEALPSRSAAQAPEEEVARYLARPGDLGLYVWDDGGPVAMAGCGGPTPNGVRIGPVYTPPAVRGRGYASALTATLTTMLLAAGRQFCFLFTVFANPTPNRIYQRIGYRAVTDFDEYRLA